MVKCSIVFLGAALLTGCGHPAQKPLNSAAGQTAVASNSDPPTIDAGLSVEEAYAAIPHRRTVWDESATSVPPQEAAYLGVIFKVMDEGVAVRVAGLQNFQNQRFDNSNVVDQFDQLIAFARGMQAPKTLASFHEDVVEALSDQRQFFADWKAQRDGFAFAQQPGNDPAVRSASNALHNAYNELMSKYPNESETNKEAFFDYPCALDFL